MANEKAFNIGFYITLTDYEVMEINGEEKNIDISKMDNDFVVKNLLRMESNALKFLMKELHTDSVYEQGHDNFDDLVGTVYIKESNKDALEYIDDLIERDESDDVYDDIIYAGVDENIALCVDVSVGFFDKVST